jgi:hypothetical protein
MTRLARLALMLACFSAALPGQRTLGYWAGEVGAATAGGVSDFRAGLAGGAEIAIGKGFSAGPEIGFITPRRAFHDNVAGLASASGFYHVRHGRPVLDPFVSAGWSALFRSDSVNFFHYGAGLNYWISPDIAVRTEFRDRLHNNGSTLHLWTFRLGLSFTHLSP